jgi:hypothetical protein
VHSLEQKKNVLKILFYLFFVFKYFLPLGKDSSITSLSLFLKGKSFYFFFFSFYVEGDEMITCVGDEEILRLPDTCFSTLSLFLFLSVAHHTAKSRKKQI